MNNTQPLSNEQKLDEVYRIIKDNEARRKSLFWWGIIKRLVIYGAIIVMYLYYPIIIGKVIEIMKPMIMEQARSIMQENQDDLMQQAKEILNK